MDKQVLKQQIAEKLEKLKLLQLVNKYQTGNFYLDTLISGLVFCLSTFTITLLYRLRITIWNMMEYYSPKHMFSERIGIWSLLKYYSALPVEKIIRWRWSTITLEGRSTSEEKLEHSAIMHKIIRIHQTEGELEKPTDITALFQKDKYIDKRFVLTENIQYQVIHQTTKTENEHCDHDSAQDDASAYDIKLYSKELNVEQMRTFIKKCKAEYITHLKIEAEKTQFYFAYDPQVPESSKFDVGGQPFEEFLFRSRVTFDNIFHEEKEKIVQLVDFFLNNKEWFNKRGIPHNIGFLFHGEDGCGITNTIKALANYTRRHIISVPIQHIKSIKQLNHLFYDGQINEKEIPLQKRLYVLKYINQACHAEGDDTHECKKLHKTVLLDLLKLLDGMMEMDGMMMVINTNCPELLSMHNQTDCIDMKVYFGRCSSQRIVQMFDAFYEMPVPEKYKQKLDEVADKKWMQAEIHHIFLGNIKDASAALEIITK